MRIAMIKHGFLTTCVRVLAVAILLSCALSHEAHAACAPNFSANLAVKVLGRVSSVLIDSQCARIYAANSTFNRVEIYSAKTGALNSIVAVGAKPAGMDTSPDGRYLYVANSGAHTISVIDLSSGVEISKIDVPLSFQNDTPYSLAVANNGLVFFSTTFNGSGSGGRLMQYDPTTGTVSLRNDLDHGGSVTEITRLRASGDRSAIGVVVGDASNGPVYKYTAASNSFGQVKQLNEFIASAALDSTGAVMLVGPWGYVLNASLSLTGTISSKTASTTGVAVDPAGAVGYQTTASGVDVVDLVHFTKIASLAIGDTVTKADLAGFSQVGELAISSDGALLAAVTDGGFSLIRSSYGGGLNAGGSGGGSTPIIVDDSGAAGTCAPQFLSSMAIKTTGAISDVLIDAQCKYVFAANATSNRIEVYAAATGSLQSTIAVGSQPSSIDTSPDGSLLYAANSGANNISVVDLARGTEISKIDVPPSLQNDTPYSLAVARNGLVLFSTTFNGGGYGGRLMQYNPTNRAVSVRNDFDGFGSVTEITRLKASGDRSVIGVAIGDVYPATIFRYTSANDAFSVMRTVSTSESFGYNSIAFNDNGSVALMGPASYIQHRAAYVLDGNFNITGTIPGGGTGYSVAVDPLGRVGYQIQQSGIEIYNLTRFTKTGRLSLGDTVGARSDKITIPGRSALSRDGKLLAVTTDNGLTLVRAGDLAGPSLRVMALSTTTNNRSFLRFYNQGESAGTVAVTLADLTTGKTLAQWTSPTIPPGAAPQYAVEEIEAAASRPFTKPSYYALTIHTSMAGTFSHVVFNGTAGSLMNLSTCDSGVESVPARLVNVHNSLFDSGYPSTLMIANTGTQVSIAKLGVFDAATGGRIGNYISPEIASGGARLVTIDDIETNAGVAAIPTRQHYVIKLEDSFSGYIQHFVLNQRPGVLTDMTTTCAIP